MNLDKLTVRSQEDLQSAQQSALRLGHPEITPEHLLLSLVEEEGGLAPVLLQRIGVDVPRLRSRLQETLQSRPRVQGGAPPGLDDRLRSAVEKAESRAAEFRDDFVDRKSVV